MITTLMKEWNRYLFYFFCVRKNFVKIPELLIIFNILQVKQFN